MEVRYFCAVLAVIALELVLQCDAETEAEDSHLCPQTFNEMKTIMVTKRCGRNICTKVKKYYEKNTLHFCCKGWVRSAQDGKCIPNCKLGCTQGRCVAPDVCECDPPLILKRKTTCEEPLCNPSCVNAKCVDDDKCSCNEGFKTHNVTHCAPICRDGFVNDPQTLDCKPICDKCVNGICTAPNECTCNEGYSLQNFTCVPYCNQSCKNGKCIAPNTCECSAGYSIDPSDKSLCHPICENICQNATCIDPNKCACLEGYEPSSSWSCKPKCDPCNNGECVAPNQCKCLKGYFRTDKVNCMPVCSEACSNGYCSAPNTCTCNKGYELDEEDKFKCQPICKDSCINSTCTSPDTCTCNSGFEKVNSSVCTPLCEYCEHGICVSPGNCQCNTGFKISNGICKPVCSSPCVNGFCESPEKCACNEGYIKNVTQSICHKPCIGECDKGKCNIDGKCECDSGYELFNNSCIVPDSCDKCNATCPDDDCRCEDERPCHPSIDEPAEISTSLSLAGLQLTWVLVGCVGIFLITIVIITIGFLWRKRKEYGEKSVDNGSAYPSVLYTIPNTLIQNNYGDNQDDYNNENDNENTKEAVHFHLLKAEKDAKEEIAL